MYFIELIEFLMQCKRVRKYAIYKFSVVNFFVDRME